MNTSAKTLNVTLQPNQTLNVTNTFGAFGNARLASVYGIKYLDVNMSGTFDNNDTPLSGWTVNLTNSSGLVGSVVTNASGFFRFSNLTPGNYTLSEVVQPGYENTSNATMNITLTTGQTLNVTQTYGLFGNINITSFVYVANAGSNVSLINTSTDTVLASIPVGLNPYGVAVG